jgi:hypothetical protein
LRRRERRLACKFIVGRIRRPPYPEIMRSTHQEWNSDALNLDLLLGTRRTPHFHQSPSKGDRKLMKVEYSVNALIGTQKLRTRDIIEVNPSAK